MQSVDCGFDGDIMIYHARIEGTFKTDSGSLLTIIEEWVGNDGVRIIVTGVEIIVYRLCSFFNDSKCSKQHATSSTPSHDSSSYTAVITGGVVTVVLIMCVVIIVPLILIKYRQTHGELVMKYPKYQ